MKIIFGTTNEGKLKEARMILEIEIDGTPLEIEEIQSLDPEKVATQKARDYFSKLQQPVLVEDVSLVFNALTKLPGTYINDFSKALGNDGLVKILENYTDRSAVAQTTLAFCDKPGRVEIFTGVVEGHIASELKGTNGFGWDPIFIPKGQKKTFAQMPEEEKNRFSMRALALLKFKNWLGNNLTP